MKSKVFTKRVFSLELSEEELSIIAGALYCVDGTDIKYFVDEYKYPCNGYNFDEINDIKYNLSEQINKLVEGKN